MGDAVVADAPQFKASTSGQSKTWAVAKAHVASFTGGKFQISGDGTVAAAACSDGVALLDLSNGQVKLRVQHAVAEEHREVITSFALRPSPSGKAVEIVTASRNQLLRHWELESGACKRAWKAHRTPVLSMDFEATGTLLATGGSDRAVMVWDVDKGYCTHNFRGHTGIVTTLRFHPSRNPLQLVSACHGNELRMWNLMDAKKHKQLKNHVGAVTSVVFSEDGSVTVTGGRDKVLSFWDSASGALLCTMPVYEQVEGLQPLPSESCLALLRKPSTAGPRVTFHKLSREVSREAQFVMSAGDRGTLRLWTWWRTSDTHVYCACVAEVDVLKAGDVASRGTGAGAGAGAGAGEAAPTWAQFQSLLWNDATSEVVAVAQDHSVVTVSGATLARTKQIVGYNDEITDVCYVPVPLNKKGTSMSTLPTRVAVATNSEQLRIFDVNTFGSESFIGHTAVILAVACSPDGRFVATSSKDKTVRVWRISDSTCVATCEGHTDAVGAVSFPHRAAAFAAFSTPWVVSGSKDKTIKMWSLKDTLHEKDNVEVSQPRALKTMLAVKAHDKDINCLAVSPNDKLIASASQDKSIKLWSSTDLSLTGTLRGHRRGVWDVVFSQVDKVVASASGDRTVRLWSVTDHSCIKVFEGHASSVLRVRFVRAGMQLVTAGADGLVKLWSVKDNLCVNTFDNHTDRVWALAVRAARDGSGDNEMISGGSDSVVNVWADTTAEEAEQAMQESEAKLLKQQELYNAMAMRDYSKAVALCIELEQPKRLRLILEELLTVGPIPLSTAEQKRKAIERELAELDEEEDALIAGSTPSFGSDEGWALFQRVLDGLSADLLDRVLRYVREWNTTARTSLIAHHVLKAVLVHVPADRLAKVPEIADVIDHVAPYAERHFERLDRMLQQTYLLQYTLSCMNSLDPSTELTLTADPVATHTSVNGIEGVVEEKGDVGSDGSDSDVDVDVDSDEAGSGDDTGNGNGASGVATPGSAGVVARRTRSRTSRRGKATTPAADSTKKRRRRSSAGTDDVGSTGETDKSSKKSAKKTAKKSAKKSAKKGAKRAESKTPKNTRASKRQRTSSRGSAKA